MREDLPTPSGTTSPAHDPVTVRANRADEMLSQAVRRAINGPTLSRAELLALCDFVGRALHDAMACLVAVERSSALASAGSRDPSPEEELANLRADSLPPRGGKERSPMIEIHPSPTADTRTCDFAHVTKATLLASSVQHIADVGAALAFFGQAITRRAVAHDTDKLTDIDGFHADFLTGFTVTDWWDRHRTLNRHHLTMGDGIPADVNLIDVLDFIADCVMAGMARSGSVYALKLSPELLEKAFQNTVEMLKDQIVVVTPPAPRGK
jgi:hypothetical protein